MAIYTNSSGVAYKAVVVVDPETGQMGTGGGTVTALGGGIWGPDQFYQGVVIVDPETGLPTSFWAQSDGINTQPVSTYRLILENAGGFIVTETNQIIKRG